MSKSNQRHVLMHIADDAIDVVRHQGRTIRELRWPKVSRVQKSTLHLA